VDEAGGIIAGHGRVLAARKLGLVDVPVMIAAGWSEAQKRAYILADNKLTENAGWDQALLKLEVSDLAALGFDIPLMGFSETELAGLTGSNPGLTDPDEVPPAPAIATSAVGDVWHLGRHRLVCGDATNAADVAKALAGVQPHLMVTDPPYGVDYDPNWRNQANRWSGSNVKLGASAIGRVENDNCADWCGAWNFFGGDVAYVWHAALRSSEVAASLVSSGFDLRSQIIWNKTRLVIGRGNYHWQHEPCWYVVRKNRGGSWNGDRTQSTVWDIPKSQTSETGHSTQKPVECMKRPIENNSSPGQAVYDPFVGSGTTIIAAEMTGRACHALEINPAYADVSIMRWQNFTGEQAKLEATGQTFEERTKHANQKAQADASESDHREPRPLPAE
jgi:DNA modification methylase